MKTTNVKPSQLNYDHYGTDKYDRDIVNSIPHHREMHEAIVRYVRGKLGQTLDPSILDLGTGTGLTSKLIQQALPNATFDLVDFSRKMLSGARKKFGKDKNVRYLLGDYSTMEFDKTYDLVISVIGLHHQSHEGKRLMFKKIHSLLKPDGTFIFGDLMTYNNPKKAALNQALHFHHLTENSSDRKTLEDWSYHHLILNNLATIEEQIEWLNDIGFKVKKEMHKINTALLICKKKL